MMRKIGSLRRDESGVTAIEYGLIAGLVAVLLIGSLNLVGGSLQTLFTTVSTQLNTASGVGGTGTGATPP